MVWFKTKEKHIGLCPYCEKEITNKNKIRVGMFHVCPHCDKIIGASEY